MDLQYYIDELQKVHTDKCLVITDNELEKPHPMILWANTHFEELTGYSLEELKQNSPRVLQGEKSERATLDRLKKTLLEGNIFEGGITNYRKDGSEFYKAWRIVPLCDETGKIDFYFAVHQETTIQERLDTLRKITQVQQGILHNLELLLAKSP